MPELTEPLMPLPGESVPAPVAPPTENTPEATVPIPTGEEPLPVPDAEPVVTEPPLPAPESSLPVPDDVWTAPPVVNRSLSSPPQRRIPVSIWLSALLIPYAVMSTIGLIYLFQQRQQNKEPHILESIPDQGLYEDFLDGRRHEVVQPVTKAGEKTSNNKIIPPNEPISKEMAPIKLGETRRVGQLEVTPLAITKQPVRYSIRGGKTDVPGEEVLVLKLQVKNVGQVVFRPDDETFNRAFINDARSPVYTYLEMGKDRFYGVISDPSSERLTIPTCDVLLPGQSGAIYIVADKTSDGRKTAVSALKTGEQYLWRVHLRRGKEEIALSTGKKRNVWLTTVVPISFSAAEVK